MILRQVMSAYMPDFTDTEKGYDFWREKNPEKYGIYVIM